MVMARIDRIEHNITLPDGVTCSISGDHVTIAKDGSSLNREFRDRKVTVVSQDGAVKVVVDLPRRKEKALAGTWAAHLRNMVKGVDEGFTYKLKAVYSHFPMTISVNGNEMLITNLFGEKVPRRAKLPWSPAQVEVEVKGKTEVFVRGADIEKVGQTAANIERACRIRRRDRRVFQDGIYIVEKAI